MAPYFQNSLQWWWPSWLSFFPIIDMDALASWHAWWNKEKFWISHRTCQIGAFHLVPICPPQLPLPGKTLNTPQYWLKQGTQGLWSVIRDMLDTGVIRPNTSHSDSLIWPVWKLATNEWRLTIDYRNLNAHISAIKAPIPNIIEMVDDIQKT